MNINLTHTATDFAILKIHAEKDENKKNDLISKIGENALQLIEKYEKVQLSDSEKKEIKENLNSKLTEKMQSLGDINTHINYFKKEFKHIKESDPNTRTSILNDLKSHAEGQKSIEKGYSIVKRIINRFKHFFKGQGIKTDGEYGLHLANKELNNEKALQKKQLTKHITGEQNLEVSSYTPYYNSMEISDFKELVNSTLPNINYQPNRLWNAGYIYSELDGKHQEAFLEAILKKNSPVDVAQNMLMFVNRTIKKEDLPDQLVSAFKKSLKIEAVNTNGAQRKIIALLATRLVEKELSDIKNNVDNLSNMNAKSLISKIITSCKRLGPIGSKNKPVNIHQDPDKFLSKEDCDYIEKHIMTKEAFEEAKIYKL